MAFETVGLWQKTLGTKLEDTSQVESARERLRVAFERFRERAATIADEIARSYPWLTVHDITHLDALWEMADLIAGREYPINPIEAFILGGAFLVHDLGNGLAAYPGGEAALRKTQAWRDAIGALVRRQKARAPLPEELDNPSPTIARAALEEALRLQHAKQAAQILKEKWISKEGRQFWLLEDDDIREYYGGLVGNIAESHWWDVAELEARLKPELLNAPPWMPSSWRVDAIKVACLLRVSDAAHLDLRRAPSFVRTVRKPEGFSDVHWKFQEKLGRPTLQADRLLYNAGCPFTHDEAEAWWLCFDSLCMVDRELRKVNELLSETHRPPERNRPPLAAHGVVGIEEPGHLANHILTKGWVPIDARVYVSDLPLLIEKLGGKSLYGDDPIVPLRELIQNATDAIRARRVLDKDDDWGKITVRINEDSTAPWIEVEDNGIGMSEVVLTRHLLDFGTSFWGSSSMRAELPGLAESKFWPTGQFGIGFFSIFMWGSHISVATRRYDESYDATRVLEFSQGLKGRPILRRAGEDERIKEGGTRVRVWLSMAPTDKGGILTSWKFRRDNDKGYSLATLCEWLCPSLDVDLYAVDKNGKTKAISAQDWLRMDSSLLLKRIGYNEAPTDVYAKRNFSTAISDNLRILGVDSGEIFGRAAICEERRGTCGVITVGGIRSTELRGIAGILLGNPMRASRDAAIPLVNQPALARWASEQANALPRVYDGGTLFETTPQVSYFGGNLATLPICVTNDGLLTVDSVEKWAKDLNEILILQDLEARHRKLIYWTAQPDNVIEIKAHLKRNVAIISYNTPHPIMFFNSLNPMPPWPYATEQKREPMEATLIDVVARAWAVDRAALSADNPWLMMNSAEPEREKIRTLQEVATLDGNPVRVDVKVLRRPVAKKQA